MNRKSRPGDLSVNIGIALTSVVVAVMILVIAVQIAGKLFGPRAGPPLHILCGDCPYIYELNPDHPEISAQGLRDKEYPYSKTPGTTRVLVLGDSVAYGLYVSAEQAFPSVLERPLRQVRPGMEVINAAVSGYTPYNELHLYMDKLRLFGPDIVIVAFSMNDIVDPTLHWNYTQDEIIEVPTEAIPNPQYHEAHIVPTVEAIRDSSALPWAEELARLQSRITSKDFLDDERRFSTENGRRWPTYITGEDVISIKTLMDYDSQEWVWLRGMYDELLAAVEADGGRMVLLALPLSYQLDPAYPYLPQDLLRRYADQSGMEFVDVLPAFRKHKDERLFQDEEHGYKDIWHLTRRGHQLVAEELEKVLRGK